MNNYIPQRPEQQVELPANNDSFAMLMLNEEYKVCVATVTYANRWHLLEQVLNRVLELQQVSHIVVVDNRSDYDVAEKVRALNTNRVIVIRLAENQGSAGGYANAIAFADRNTDADLVWLLDDDNLPETNALNNLLMKWDEIEGANNKKALFCLREDRAHHVKIAQGEDPYRYYLVPDNFLGFSLFRILNNRIAKMRDKRVNNAKYINAVSIPYTPYGGLLFHKSIIADIGLPDERLFVYVDDSEYTYRITQNSGTIWLVPGCRITDIEQSQGLGYKKKRFHSQLLDQWGFRTYYHVRNRMYFYSRAAVKSNIKFELNKNLYLIYLHIISLLTSKKQEYKKLKQAVDDGLQGVLGKADSWKF